MPVRVHVRYKPNHREFGAMMRGAFTRRWVIEAAKDIRLIAEQTATHRTGNYARSFKVNTDPGLIVKGGNKRAYAEVYNDDEAAAGQEFGDRWGNPPQRTLGLAGGRVGQFRGDE